MLSAVVQKLKPAPDAEPITDPQQIDQMYRYWRLRTLYACFIGYAVFYLCRRNIPLAVPMLREELDISRGVAGLIDTAMLITYGVGKFCNGILADRTNPRFLMALGLLLSAVANLLFGFTTAVFLLVFLFAMNGWFQSMGFPPGARLLSHWYSPSEGDLRMLPPGRHGCNWDRGRISRCRVWVAVGLLCPCDLRPDHYPVSARAPTGRTLLDGVAAGGVVAQGRDG